MNPERRARLLSPIDPARATDRGAGSAALPGRGAELGPCAAPVVRREDGDVTYVDAFTTAALRERMAQHGVDPAAVVDVEVVWRDAPLAACLGARAPLDWVVASHVIEHAPDVVGWLDEVALALRPGGVLSLAVPDGRFTFDCRRALTTPGQALEAHLLRRRAPTPAQVYDFWSRCAWADAARLWDGASPDEMPLRAGYGPAVALEKAALAAQGELVDAHCSVWTPATFLELVGELGALGLLRLEVTHLVETRRGEDEFFVAMRRLPDLPPAQRAAAIARSVAAARPAPPPPPAPAAPSATPAPPRSRARRLAQALLRRVRAALR